MECTFACPVYYFSLEDEVPPKRESFAEMPLAPGFDFECPFVLLKDGLKKSNPTITANYHRISTLVSSCFSGKPRRSSFFLQCKNILAIS
ncbi:hypothetical protein Y696_05355 [Mesotoga sp. H07pep.5.4]|nr:hypothetical protein Y696_05355 [Mesotoga sp. H07pep.5.4]